MLKERKPKLDIGGIFSFLLYNDAGVIIKIYLYAYMPSLMKCTRRDSNYLFYNYLKYLGNVT